MRHKLSAPEWHSDSQKARTLTQRASHRLNNVDAARLGYRDLTQPHAFFRMIILFHAKRQKIHV